MVYNDTTNYQGVIQEIERLTDLGIGTISGDTANLKNFTAQVNNESRRIWASIFKATGNWEYDDANNVDLPEATTNLVSGIQKYSLPSTALTVQRVECKDAGGLWYVIYPFTKQQVATGLDEFMKTPAVPQFYRLLNGELELFPAPNYNSTNGLKVYFDRESVDFATTDTTATPGFASPFHKLLPLKVAIEWLDIKQPNSGTLAGLRQKEQKMELDLVSYYGKRWKNYKARIGRASQSYT